MARLARSRDHVELPEVLSGSGVIALDIGRNVFDPGLVVAGLVTSQYDDHAVHDDRRRRTGDLSQRPREPVVWIERLALPVQPGIPIPHKVRNHVDDTGPRE